ncbi:putative repeat protein (TIGR03943 family) [Streptomyces candidus]|uniref:Putative repeat protein (TIGR03943 family) n=1 Tax=Streptomyces candidus TaxID=67283 RepID=A0A7X0HKE1_9ACTN|nr:TIGR03943 family protein [Streptomyces candidus]MBB6439270.1 putative repeat protein (TIGR03943 family) [Streptomyces candidus]GHH44806.1 TIGR03943 family protein [Streptomyces candidus]
MRPGLQNVLLLLLGAGVLRISLFSDICLRYVKEGLQPYVVVAGLMLTALGALGVARDGIPFPTRRQPVASPDVHPHPAGHDGSGHGDASGAEPGHGNGHRHAPEHDVDLAPDPASEHGHDHSRGPRVAWLLLPPALALLLFAPPALGSYTAARDSPQLVVDYDSFTPLPASGPVPLSMTEYVARLQQEESGSLKGRTVVLQGFVTPGKGGTWKLTRLVVSCCAADSQSLSVAAHGRQAPPADTWVRVTGTWRPEGTLGTTSAAIALDIATLERIPEPANPYLDRAPGR